MIVPPRGGELIGDSPERRVEILCDHDAVHATWSRFGPGREGADLHVHRRHSDVFYVLDGELTVRLGPQGEERVAQAGTVVLVPPLVVHGFRNGSDAEVRYLNFHAPGSGFADYMRALRDGETLAYDQHPPPDDGGRSPDDVIVGPPPVVTDAIALEIVDGGEVEFGYVLDGSQAGSWVQDETVTRRLLRVRPAR
jgi:mannose-6-phosphate isomerase-like protein (cupin superfamily)